MSIIRCKGIVRLSCMPIVCHRYGVDLRHAHHVFRESVRLHRAHHVFREGVRLHNALHVFRDGVGLSTMFTAYSRDVVVLHHVRCVLQKRFGSPLRLLCVVETVCFCTMSVTCLVTVGV